MWGGQEAGETVRPRQGRRGSAGGRETAPPSSREGEVGREGEGGDVSTELSPGISQHCARLLGLRRLGFVVS